MSPVAYVFDPQGTFVSKGDHDTSFKSLNQFPIGYHVYISWTDDWGLYSSVGNNTPNAFSKILWVTYKGSFELKPIMKAQMFLMGHSIP